MVDLIREVAGSPAPIDVETITVGEGESVPIVSRLLPLIVLMAVLIAGALTPATSLVEEKEKRTLTALLVTPTRLGTSCSARAHWASSWPWPPARSRWR